MQPLISICIPAYKRIEFLKILLDSIAIQQFRDFEVIVTDDSPDNDVGQLCESYSHKFLITHQRNVSPLGTPENWNQAIRLANGKWIKLMHDDDWFSSPDSLGKFAATAESHPDDSFIFSSYVNVLSNKKSPPVTISKFRMKQLIKDPVSLLSKNCIGPPSVVLHRNDKKFWYDSELKWLVDMDFYVRYLSSSKPLFIHEPLISIGINEHQVTKQSSLVAEIEIPEHFKILNKTGTRHFRNILVYDAWWRLFRNLRVKREVDIRKAGYHGIIPEVLKHMIAIQSRYSYKVLKNGFISKILMFLSYQSARSSI